MKANKLGIVFVVAVLGLAGIGASYAGFTDQITLTGTATTGSVDLEVVAISGTWVWKEIDTHTRIIHHDWIDSETYPDAMGDPVAGESGWSDDDNYELVAYVVGTEGPDDTIEFDFHNLYPLYEEDEQMEQFYMFDVLFHYKGKTPARISANPEDQLTFDYPEHTGTVYDGWMDYLMDEYFEPHMYRVVSEKAGLDDGYWYENTDYYDPADMDSNSWFDSWIPIEGGQVHYCDFLKLDIFIDIPQDSAKNEMELPGDFENFQDLSVDATYIIDLIQFDEYVE